jgi:hypothetical protein
MESIETTDITETPRREIIRFNEAEYDYQIDRIETFCDALNEIYNRLIKDFPEEEIKANIKAIQACVADRGFKDDDLREIISTILLKLSPINDMQVSDEMKRQLLKVDNLSIEKYLPRQDIEGEMRKRNLKFRSVKSVTWYAKTGKFIITKNNKEIIKDQCSTFVQGEDLVIYDQLQKVIIEIKELMRIGNTSDNMIDLRGLGIQTRDLSEINTIPFIK